MIYYHGTDEEGCRSILNSKHFKRNTYLATDLKTAKVFGDVVLKLKIPSQWVKRDPYCDSYTGSGSFGPGARALEAKYNPPSKRRPSPWEGKIFVVYRNIPTDRILEVIR